MRIKGRLLFFILKVAGIPVTLRNLLLKEYYSSQGYVCFIPNYRVRSSENSRAIDSVRDAQDAFVYVRKNSDQFGIDPNRIAASGGSAGGHLAASLGTLKDGAWSGRQDFNLRPLAPHASALPDCATATIIIQ